MGRRPAWGLWRWALVLGLTACSAPAPAPAPAPTAAGRDAALTAGATLPAATAQEPAPPVAAPAPQPEEPSAVISAGGIVVPVLGREGDGWKVSTPCGRDAVVTSVTPLPSSPVV